MTADSTGVHGTTPSLPPSNRRISIIVPTLNEAENVDALIRDILGATSALGQVEVIVVDDGSTDGTRHRIMAWEADPIAGRLTQTPGRWGRYAWPFTVVSAMLFYGAALHYLVLGLPPFAIRKDFAWSAGTTSGARSNGSRMTWRV